MCLSNESTYIIINLNSEDNGHGMCVVVSLCGREQGGGGRNSYIQINRQCKYICDSPLGRI